MEWIIFYMHVQIYVTADFNKLSVRNVFTAFVALNLQLIKQSHVLDSYIILLQRLLITHVFKGGCT